MSAVRWALPGLCALWMAGCASGTSLPAGCGEARPCPRGELCVDGQCTRDEPMVIPTDGGPVDAIEVPVDRAVPPVDAAIDAGRPDGGECIPHTTRLCGDGPAIGLCRRGMQVCGLDGFFGECAGAVGPTDEQCNRADDDCDGRVDEGLGLGDACEGVGTCGAGVVECRNARELRCSTDPGGSEDGSGPEACDGRDDDCDGATDEDYGAGDACVGRCGPGVIECSAAGAPVCSTDPAGSEADGRPERCDGFDNDCDGAVDEGYDLGGGCVAPGRCGVGAWECADDGTVRCSSAPGGSASGAQPEVCDGLDDDCDSMADEGFDLGAPCDGALPCGAGVLECGADGRARCSTDPGGSAEDGVERCNARDDDCDGRVDEGLNIGAPCPALGACPASTLACGAAERLVCATHPGGAMDASSPETCDGGDDDCDGRVDEGLGLGEACDGVGLCGPGLVECGPAGLAICSTEPAGSADASADEACNQLDDDCDGRIDERGVCGGEACAGGIPLDPGVTALGDTDGLVSDYGRANCLGVAEAPDQVFRFDVPERGPYVVGVAPLDGLYDPIFWVAGDCPAAEQGTCLQADARQTVEGAGRPEAAAINFIRGGRFALVVDGRGAGDRGPFAVTVDAVSAGEGCNQAVSLPFPGRYVGTTARRTADVAARECPAGAVTVGPDQVFRFELDAPTRVRAAVTGGAQIRVALSVAADCGRIDETCAGGAVAAAPGDPVALEVDLDAGAWFVIVDHPVQAGGPFLLELDAAD